MKLSVHCSRCGHRLYSLYYQEPHGTRRPIRTGVLYCPQCRVVNP